MVSNFPHNNKPWFSMPAQIRGPLCRVFHPEQSTNYLTRFRRSVFSYLGSLHADYTLAEGRFSSPAGRHLQNHLQPTVLQDRVFPESRKSTVCSEYGLGPLSCRSLIELLMGCKTIGDLKTHSITLATSHYPCRMQTSPCERVT